MSFRQLVQCTTAHMSHLFNSNVILSGDSIPATRLSHWHFVATSTAAFTFNCSPHSPEWSRLRSEHISPNLPFPLSQSSPLHFQHKARLLRSSVSLSVVQQRYSFFLFLFFVCFFHPVSDIFSHLLILAKSNYSREGSHWFLFFSFILPTPLSPLAYIFVCRTISISRIIYYFTVFFTKKTLYNLMYFLHFMICITYSSNLRR